MKDNKGITLVALVITVIVLIILAGISINMLLGEGGIITKAKQAKENIEIAAIEEQGKLNVLYDKLGNRTNLETEYTTFTGQEELDNLRADIDMTTATENDILTGKSAYTKSGLINGNIPIGDNIESVSTWSTYNGKDSFIIPRGYYDGTKQVALGRDSSNKYYNQVEVFDKAGVSTQTTTLSFSFSNLDINKKYVANLAAHKETGNGGWYAPSITSTGTSNETSVLGTQVPDKNNMYTCQASYFFTPTQSNVTINFSPTTNGSLEWTGVCQLLSY